MHIALAMLLVYSAHGQQIIIKRTTPPYADTMGTSFKAVFSKTNKPVFSHNYARMSRFPGILAIAGYKLNGDALFIIN